uniref:DUF6598 domain-containing protein n=1 Tax=Aegilops tauschii TaxID=37682 RepID=N1QT62_AEGTA
MSEAAMERRAGLLSSAEAAMKCRRSCNEAHTGSLKLIGGCNGVPAGAASASRRRLRYRIQSLASVLRESNSGVPVVSPDKAKTLLLVSRALASISGDIASKHGSPNPRKSATEEDQVSSYKEHRAGWKSTWGGPIGNTGGFHDITTLSPMHFTRRVPVNIPDYFYVTPALQIYSFKIFRLNENLNWPLHVYGVVAARDDVDSNRNLLFCRSRANYQVLTEKDPFLRLTGPSRAIQAKAPVDFEVELKIKYGTESQDIAFFCSTNHHHMHHHTAWFPGSSCDGELSLQTIGRAVQATVLGVCVLEGGPPFEYGCRVACSLSSAELIEDLPSNQVVLLDCHGEQIPVESDGYLTLSRNVVTAELQGTLKVVIQAYAESGAIAGQGDVDFPSQHCQMSRGVCFVGNSKVEIVVAWSLLVEDKLDIL